MGVFSYYDTETDGVVYHVIPSPESERPPSSFESEAETMNSGTTIESEDLPGYFVIRHGRQQPASNNVAKWFPSDNIRRHTLRYFVAKRVFGGEVVGPVVQMLGTVDGRERRVLELGTKTGIWIQAMATQFPHVQFQTIDIVPIIPHVPRQNVKFEVYDYTEGLLLEDGSQDAVFLSFILEMVRDYRGLLREVHRVLRPGGFIYITERDPRFWDPKNIAVPAASTNPRIRQLAVPFRRHVTGLGIDPDTCYKLPQWLAPESDLWSHPQAGFKDIQLITRTNPAYPHEGFSCTDHIDADMILYSKHLFSMSMRDMSGLLRDAGMGDKEVDNRIEGLLDDLSRHENCVLLKLNCLYATKI